MNSRRLSLIAGLALALLPAASARAERSDPIPREMQGIGIDNKLGAQLPLDALVRDESGALVPIGRYFTGKKPVMLTLVYYGCPLLCGLLLNQFTSVAGELEWSIGQDYEVVTLSFDPGEGAELAAKKKANYLEVYGRQDAASATGTGPATGWHFLTADEASIKRITAAFGFNYRWLEERREWGHSTGVFVCTPTGKLARLLNGLPTESNTMRLALLEAGEGTIGTVWDNFMMSCYHFDGDQGSYTVQAVTIMQGVGLATLLGLLALWLLLRKRGGKARGENQAPPSGGTAFPGGVPSHRLEDLCHQPPIVNHQP